VPPSYVQVPFLLLISRQKNSPLGPLLAPLSPHQAPTDLPNTPHTSNNQLGTPPLLTEVPPSCVKVAFLLLTSVLAVRVLGPFRLPRAAGDFPNADSELTGSTTERCGASSVLQCVRGVFVVDSDAIRRKNSVFGTLAPSGGRH
jgi:hypothetical protein